MATWTNFKIENMHEQFLARQKQAKGLESRPKPRKRLPRPAQRKPLFTLQLTRTAPMALLPWRRAMD